MFDIPTSEIAAARQLQVNPHIVRLALAELKKAGGDLNAICAGLEFSPSDIESPDSRISYFQASQAIRRTFAALGDPLVGLRIGIQHHPVSWGLVGFGAMAASTLREAVEFGMRFQHEAGSLLILALDISRGRTSIQASPRFSDVAIEACLVDGTFAAIVQAARRILVKEFKPEAVELMAQKPPSTDMHHQFFNCPVRFGCARNRMLVGKEWGLGDVKTGDSLALKRIEQSLDANATNGKNAALESLIETRLRDDLRNPPSLGELGRQLNMSERNLRRKLMEAGRSYVDMLDQARQGRALELIAHSQCTSREVADAIGFSDTRSLRRAFKRWTGKSLTSALKPSTESDQDR